MWLLPRVKCFIWLVARKKCLTHEAMQERRINIVSRCLLCKEALETNKHLFMHCKVTAQPWVLFTTIDNEYWTMPEHTSDLLSCWIKGEAAKVRKDGEQFQHVSGGLYGKKGIREFFKQRSYNTEDQMESDYYFGFLV